MNIGYLSNYFSKIASLNDAERFIFYKYFSDNIYKFAQSDDFDDSYEQTSNLDTSLKGDLTPDLISKAELVKSLSLSGDKSGSDKIMSEVLSSKVLTKKQKKDFKKYVMRLLLAGSPVKDEGQFESEDSNFAYQSKDMSRSFSLLKKINSEVSKVHPDIFEIIYNRQNPLYGKCRNDLKYEKKLSEKYLGSLADVISDVVSTPGFTYFEENPNRLQESSFEYFYYNPSHIPQDVTTTLASCMGSTNPSPQTVSKCLWKNADRRLISDNSTSIRNACLEEILERVVRKEPAMMCFLVRMLLRHTDRVFSQKKSTPISFEAFEQVKKKDRNCDLIDIKKDIIEEFTPDDKAEEARLDREKTENCSGDSFLETNKSNLDDESERESNLKIVRNFYPSFIAHLERKKSEIDLLFNYIIESSSDESVYGNLKDICNEIKNDLIGSIDEEIDAAKLDMDKNSYGIAVSLIKKMQISGSNGFNSEIRKKGFEFIIKIKDPESLSDRDIDIILGVDISLMPSYNISVEGIPGWSKEGGYGKIQIIKEQFDSAYDEFLKGSIVRLSNMMSNPDFRKRIIGWYKTGTRGIKVNPITKKRSISSDDIYDQLVQISLSGDSLRSYLSGLMNSRYGNENLKLFLDKVAIGKNFGQQVRSVSSFRDNFKSLIMKLSKDAQMPPSVVDAGIKLFSTQNSAQEKVAYFDSESRGFLSKMASYIRSR